MRPHAPPPGTHGPELRIDAFREPAEGDSDCCGDFYDAVRTDGVVRVIVGDVMGHGPGAARLARILTPAWRAYATTEPVLRGAALRLGRYLADHTDDDHFATAVLVEIDGTGWARTILCGHPGPLVLREPAITRVQPLIVNPPLGLLELGGDWAEDVMLPFRPGDGLLVCTDGVTDARRADGARYPFADRVGDLAATGGPLLLRDLAADLTGWRDEDPRDDVLMVLLRHHATTGNEALQPT